MKFKKSMINICTDSSLSDLSNVLHKERGTWVLGREGSEVLHEFVHAGEDGMDKSLTLNAVYA